ncbi:hypothetical protein P7K49_014827, partial [Saguinus oedipus]
AAAADLGVPGRRGHPGAAAAPSRHNNRAQRSPGAGASRTRARRRERGAGSAIGRRALGGPC